MKRDALPLTVGDTSVRWAVAVVAAVGQASVAN